MPLCSGCHVDYADPSCKAKRRVCYQCCSQSANTCSRHFSQMPPHLQQERGRGKRAASRGLTPRTARRTAASTTPIAGSATASSISNSLASSVFGSVLSSLSLWFGFSPPHPPPPPSADAAAQTRPAAERRIQSAKAATTTRRSTKNKRTAEAMDGQSAVKERDTKGWEEPAMKRRRTRRAATDKGAGAALESAAKTPRSRTAGE